ncbi:MAG: cytotoxic translational repressor [uncultured bacterium]|nr:MAG: cytotoxic translational repressor [uncultured bacterium]
MNFTLVFPASFEKKLKKLPADIKVAAKKTLLFIAENPKHPSLKTHKVHQAVGDFGGDVFEAYVTQKYRLTWEYGPDQGCITLRNIDNHDECLKKA